MADSETTNAPLHIAVMMPTWVGDACMATPTLRALRIAYPNAKITLIARPVIQELLSPTPSAAVLQDGQPVELPLFDECVLYSKRQTTGVHNRFSLTQALRSIPIDVGLLLTNAFWAAAAMRLAGAKRIVGYDRDARGWLLTDRIVPPRQGKRFKAVPAIDYYLRLADWLGCPSRDRTMSLSFTERDRQAADQLWTKAGLDPNLGTVILNNNAATDTNRVWPSECVCELSMRIAEELGTQVLLHCGPSERDEANRIAAEVNHPSVVSMGLENELPIGLSKAILARAQLVVSTDSGARHIAIAMNRPVITLFGSTSPAWTQTYNYPETHIMAPRESPETIGSLTSLSVAEVYQSVVSSLQNQRQTQTRPIAA